jgi:hypothetical protein
MDNTLIMVRKNTVWEHDSVTGFVDIRRHAYAQPTFFNDPFVDTNGGR